ncbi:alpha-L-fucosidase [Candidatus Poribacteria bacterium]|nr:alpha-L-fucosidase [Candidatus Poribacteria bacterium]
MKFYKVFLIFSIAILLITNGLASGEDASFENREVPQWYQDAKLGIFIHWGIYSVPAFATGKMDIEEVFRTLRFDLWLADNPYSAWYLNSMKIEGSPTQKYHVETYGENFLYENFAKEFNKSAEKWNPHDWAELFKEAGARYVVLTSKHHDGFLLWPGETPHPSKSNYYASRDIVGELTKAVRQKDMHMGLYYSSGLDWTFKTIPIKDLPTFMAAVPQTPEYADYVDSHWRELIRRYKPEVLWADIGSPGTLDLESLFNYYYTEVPTGVVNDRHRIDITAQKKFHHDFATQEYMVLEDISEKKWESTRGMGRSFAYNKMDNEYISVDEIVDTLVDIVSKNGNFLLNIGPKPHGMIPEGQRKRLLGLGAWLKINGEAIYGSHYWDRAEGKTSGGVSLRFTKNHGNLYAILLERPESESVTIMDLTVSKDAEINLLGTEGKLSWEQTGEDLTIKMPEEYADSEAYVLRIKG